MKSKGKLLVAGLASFFVGAPLAEPVQAGSTANVVFTSLEAALAITLAAISAS